MRLAFTSAGAPRHGLNLQKQVQRISDAEGWQWQTEFWEWKQDGYESYDFSSVDWIWNMGNFERVFDWFAEKKLENPKFKCIAQWIGTDLLQHQSMIERGYPDPFDSADIHIADAWNLQLEANELTGLQVGMVRSIPPKVYERKPFTRWDNVLAYVPQGREPFFRWDWILELAKQYPDITFNIIPRPKTTDIPNVNEIQEIDGEEKDALFEKCFAYLRPIEHDGIGLTLIEMAQLGRWVFHSDVRIPYVKPARSVGEMMFFLDEVTNEQPPKVMSDYYRGEFNEEKLAEDVINLKGRMEEKQ